MAWPTAPAFPSVLLLRVHHSTHPIPRAPPAHLWHGRTHVVRPPTPGGRGSPPLRRVWKVSACNRRRPSTKGGASGTPPLTGGLYTSRCGVQREGAARAPLARAHPRCPSTHAGMAWKPSPTVGGAVDGQRGCDAPTSASTPQSRRFAPRQLAFQGSREGGVRRADVIRSPASSATPQSRRSAYSTLIFSAVMSFIVGQLAMVIMYSSSARLVLA